MSVSYNTEIVKDFLTFNVDVGNDTSRLGPNLLTAPSDISTYPAYGTTTVTKSGDVFIATTTQTTGNPGVYNFPYTSVTANTNYTLRTYGQILAGSTAYLYVYGVTGGANILWTGAPFTSTYGLIESTFNTGVNTDIRIGILWNAPTSGSSIMFSPFGFHQTSTWYDLSPNKIDLTLTGTRNLTTLGNALAYGFNSSMYWESTLAKSQLTDYRQGATVEMWVYAQTVGTRRTIFEKAATTTTSYQQEVAMTWEVAGNMSIFKNQTTYDGIGSISYNNNAWNHLVWVTYPYLDGATVYVNGVGGTLQGGTATVFPRQAGAIRIGTGYAGTMDTCGIAVCRTYSSMFTQAQVLQNYNAGKKRFGL